jgi:hypothetical protein
VVTIPSSQFALGDVLAETGVRIELPQFVQIAESLVPYLWVSEPYDHETFERRVEADDRVGSVAVVDDLTERTLYRIEWANGIDDLLDLFIDHGIWIEQANTLHKDEDVDSRAPNAADVGGGSDVWRFQLRAPTREALAELIEDCRELGMNPGIQQIVSDTGNGVGSQWGLTDKQREALLVAYEGGYFEVPRERSLTDLADRLGISRQAFTRRLMRGVGSVLAHTVILEGGVVESEDDP